MTADVRRLAVLLVAVLAALAVSFGIYVTLQASDGVKAPTSITQLADGASPSNDGSGWS